MGYGVNTGEGAWVTLHDKNLTVDKAWNIAALIMKMVSKRHISVGGIPDIYLVKDGIGPSKVEPEKVREVYLQAEKILPEIPAFILSRISGITNLTNRTN